MPQKHKKKTGGRPRAGSTGSTDDASDDAPAPSPRPAVPSGYAVAAGVALLVALGRHLVDAPARDAPMRYVASPSSRFLSLREADALVFRAKANPTNRTSCDGVDNDTACAQWYLCKAPDDPMSPNETDKEPCEGAGGLAERFRNVAFAEAARQGWPLGAFESARADLAVHRFADDAAAHEADELTWDTGARPIYQPNATLPLEARRTRVLSGVVPLTRARAYSGGDQQVGSVNLSKAPGYAHVFLASTPSYRHRVEGTAWVLTWTLWIDLPFVAEQLADYRRVAVEPTLGALAVHPQGGQEERSFWACVFGDYLAADGRWLEAAESYAHATSLDPGEADAWFGAGVAHQMVKRIGPAAEFLDRATTLRPNRPEWMAQYVTVLTPQVKLHDKANDLTIRALSSDRTNDFVREILTLAWQGRTGPVAIKARSHVEASEAGTFSLHSWHEREQTRTKVPEAAEAEAPVGGEDGDY